MFHPALPQCPPRRTNLVYSRSAASVSGKVRSPRPASIPVEKPFDAFFRVGPAVAPRPGFIFERGTNLKAWLFTILHNTFRNLRRHDVRSPVEVDSETVEGAADLAAAGHTPEQLLTRDTLDADLQAALDDLPDSFRQAVWLRDVEEFSYAEIARIVGVPIGTVMSRISRGRKLLYERLAGVRGRTGVV